MSLLAWRSDSGAGSWELWVEGWKIVIVLDERPVATRTVEDPPPSSGDRPQASVARRGDDMVMRILGWTITLPGRAGGAASAYRTVPVDDPITNYSVYRRVFSDPPPPHD